MMASIPKKISRVINPHLLGNISRDSKRSKVRYLENKPSQITYPYLHLSEKEEPFE
jgi:hypothetical protein